jgi:hypothetical protein
MSAESIGVEVGMANPQVGCGINLVERMTEG